MFIISALHQMQVLREAVEQMRFLENLLTNCHLLEMSPQSLAQIREEYLQAKNTGKLNQSILDNLAQRPANGQSAAHQHVSHHSKQLIAGLVEQREEEIEQKRLDLVVSAQKRSHSASVSLPAGQDYSQFTASSGSSQPSSGSSQTGGARKHHRHVPLEHYLHQTAADQHHHHLAAVNQESSQDDMLLNMLGGGAGGSEVACKTNDQQHDIDMMLYVILVGKAMLGIAFVKWCLIWTILKGITVQGVGKKPKSAYKAGQCINAKTFLRAKSGWEVHGHLDRKIGLSF